MIVVSDATPLIGLAKLELLDLLPKLFAEVHIPPAVYEEVVQHAPHRPGATEVQHASWIKVQAPLEQNKINYLRLDLDPGEAEALVLAEELNADWILLDEAKARLAADLLELTYIGTVGLLLLGKRAGYVTAARPLLDELRAKKFHLSDQVYDAVLQKAGES